MYEKLLFKLIEPIIGKENKELIDLLKDKRDVNEFKLAQKIGLTINQARNLLYKLYSHNIVSFTRKKDKRKGWYIYFWTLNKQKVLELLRTQAFKELENLNAQLKNRENKRFYACNECMIETSEENALHHNYICNECGQLLNLKENKTHLEEIHKEIDRIKREISSIDFELKKFKEEEDIKAEKEKKKKAKQGKNKKIKKKQKKKAKKRAAKKAKKKQKKKKG